MGQVTPPLGIGGPVLSFWDAFNLICLMLCCFVMYRTHCGYFHVLLLKCALYIRPILSYNLNRHIFKKGKKNDDDER